MVVPHSCENKAISATSWGLAGWGLGWAWQKWKQYCWRPCMSKLWTDWDYYSRWVGAECRVYGGLVDPHNCDNKAFSVQLISWSRSWVSQNQTKHFPQIFTLFSSMIDIVFYPGFMMFQTINGKNRQNGQILIHRIPKILPCQLFRAQSLVRRNWNTKYWRSSTVCNYIVILVRYVIKE